MLIIDKRLVDACVLLLGSPPRRVSLAYVQGLDVATVRRAWRVIAMASHPDALRHAGLRAAGLDGRRFVEASHAYEFLMSYLLSRPVRPHPPRRGAADRHPGSAHRPGPDRHRTADHGANARAGAERHTASERHAGDERRSEKPAAERRSEKPAGERRTATGRRTATERRGGALYYRGPVPHRRLRLAEYLYYTGRVSWQSLISALVWQRASQPRFGELARDLRNISSQDLLRILGSRLGHEHTGETAQRLQLLSAVQVDRILRLQRARRRLIGRYFVEKESMSSGLLTTLLHELYRHNARYGRS